MGEPVMFTIHDLWTIFLALCGAICTVSAAAVIIIKVVEKVKQPNKEQNVRIENLENAVEKINERLELGNKRFEIDSNRITASESQFRQATNIIIESLQVLTEHAIDGNNTEELKNMKKKLDTYLINR